MSLSFRAPLLALPLLAAGLMLSDAAHAQNLSAAQMQALRTACETDVKKLCNGVQPGGGRILLCLKEHQAEVTPPCKDSVATFVATTRKQ